MHVPIFRVQDFEGFIVGVFRTQQLFDTILENIAPGYGIVVFEGDEEIYARRPWNGRHREEWAQETGLDLHGVTWRIQTWPTPESLAKQQSPLPELALALGALLTLLLAWQAYLAQTARFRTRQAETANRKLEREILERKHAEQTLQTEQQFLAILLNNLEEGIVACDSEGVLSLFNRATREFHGLPERPLSAEQWAEHYDLYLPDGKTLMKKEDVPLFRALEGESVRNVEMMIVPKHGPRRILMASGQALFDAQGKKMGAVVVMHDISERKQAEQEITKLNASLERRVSERTTQLEAANQDLKNQIIERERAEETARAAGEQLRLIADSVPALISYLDKDSYYRFNNRAYEIWFECSRAEITGRHMQEVLGESAWSAIRPHIKAALSGQTVSYEGSLPYKTGGSRWISATYTPHIDTRGEVQGIVVLVNDISERKQAEQERARLYAAERAARTEIEASEQRLRFLALVSDTLAGSLDYKFTLENVARLAVPQFADWCMVDMLWQDGSVRRLAAAHIDPAKTEQIWELDQRYRRGADDPEGVPKVMRTGQPELYAEISDALLSAVARNAEHLTLIRSLGPKSVLVVPLMVRGQALGAITFVMAESARRYELADLALAADVARRAALAVQNARLYHEARQEIAERERVEARLKTLAAELKRSNRELQDFASVASHDLQEPLRKVQIFCDRLQTICGTTLPAQGQDYLKRMRQAAELMQSFITDLLSFSRVTSKAQPFKPVDLDQVAHAVISDLEVLIKESRGQVEIGALPTIEADPMQMHQLLQNLISNALKFHRQGEPPRVWIQADHAEDQESASNKDFPADGFCRITVRDNGIGFDEQYAERIFAVFERLHGRTEYQGTGVGLAICRKIAERHGGSITAEGRPGRGARFTVTLPVSTP